MKLGKMNVSDDRAVGTSQAGQAMAWPVLAAQFLKNIYKESEKC